MPAPQNPNVFAMTYKTKNQFDKELEEMGTGGPAGILNPEGLTYADFMRAVNACKAEKTQEKKVRRIQALFQESDNR